MQQLIVLIVVGAVLAFCAISPDLSSSDYCDDRSAAWAMAKEFVSDRLKAPSSAEFPWYSEDRVTPLEDCAFLIEGYVDSENSFGAKIRTNFMARLRYIKDSESFRLEDLRM